MGALDTTIRHIKVSTKFVESPPEYEYHLTEFDVSNIKFEKKKLRPLDSNPRPSACLWLANKVEKE